MLLLFSLMSCAVGFTVSLKCICPRDQTLHIYTHLSKEREFMEYSECLFGSASGNDGYFIVVINKKQVGYVHESQAVDGDTCKMGQRKERFLIPDMFAGMTNAFQLMTYGASAMTCMGSCGHCSCHGLCFDTLPCSMCKDILCDKTEAPQQSTTSSKSYASVANQHLSTSTVVTHSSTILPTTTLPKPPTTSVVTSAPTTMIPSTANQNPCDSSPCLNGGLCAVKDQSYACYCPSLAEGTIIFSGKRCEYKIDLSNLKPVH